MPNGIDDFPFVEFDRKVYVKDGIINRIALDPAEVDIRVGSENEPGRIFLLKEGNIDQCRKAIIALSADAGGRIHIKNGDDITTTSIQKEGIFLLQDDGSSPNIILENTGRILMNNEGSLTIQLDAKNGNGAFGGGNGSNESGGDLALFTRNQSTPRSFSEAAIHMSADGSKLIMRRVGPNFDVRDEMIILDGTTGSMFCHNADYAEEFDSVETENLEPGDVVILDDDEEKVRKSTIPYDSRVAGVYSGGGGYKPGLVLDKKNTNTKRIPVALMGKVYCKVDSSYSTIRKGDLLTTSNTPGFAMKAKNQSKAFGSVIGKALRSLDSGKELIPILVRFH